MRNEDFAESLCLQKMENVCCNSGPEFLSLSGCYVKITWIKLAFFSN
jgi:hypothetical protein